MAEIELLQQSHTFMTSANYEALFDKSNTPVITQHADGYIKVQSDVTATSYVLSKDHIIPNIPDPQKTEGILRLLTELQLSALDATYVFQISIQGNAAVGAGAQKLLLRMMSGSFVLISLDSTGATIKTKTINASWDPTKRTVYELVALVGRNAGGTSSTIRGYLNVNGVNVAQLPIGKDSQSTFIAAGAKILFGWNGNPNVYFNHYGLKFSRV